MKNLLVILISISTLNAFSQQKLTTATEFRKHIHANPELSTVEKNTSDYVVSELKKTWNYENLSRFFDALDFGRN